MRSIVISKTAILNKLQTVYTTHLLKFQDLAWKRTNLYHITYIVRRE